MCAPSTCLTPDCDKGGGALRVPWIILNDICSDEWTAWLHCAIITRCCSASRGLCINVEQACNLKS